MRKVIYNTLLALQKRLKPLTQAQVTYAHSHYEKVAYTNSRHLVWCQCCGYEEKQLPEILELNIDCGYICPKCGTRLELEKHIGKSHVEKYYHTFATTIAGWQVFRTFLATRENNRGTATHYTLNEVFQNWISEQGKEYILSISYTHSPFTGVKWKYGTPLNIPREHNYNSSGLYVSPDMFDIAGNYIYGRSTFTPVVKRNGWQHSFLQDTWNSPAEICKALLSSPEYETLAKTQAALFLYCIKNRIKDIPFHAVKICNRNNYRITDASLWLDYIKQLEELGLDTHNAHYVCPGNLAQSHADTERKIRRLHAKQEWEEQKREIKIQEKSYSKHIAPFAGIVLRQEGIVISPLLTVQQVYNEGQTMHHCVYTNNYHKKRDILLLSARHNTTPLETIELSLRTFQILQSRGKFNKPTPQHNTIISIINNNIQQIIQCSKKEYTSQARSAV